MNTNNFWKNIPTWFKTKKEGVNRPGSCRKTDPLLFIYGYYLLVSIYK